ncbi:PrsW family intramembrane metalloprotease [[Mycobacterium] nativiensis]|uniref:PrsW family intramembrane metalloprotease n=1 Tax=[Mycobacterium] nativiensis TaxID=2855503 RepID=A0ABU5XYX6_9MYCO|nr:PrsW family intramembrane metalloprotease [Mycolicibacter sp. MYC340]MEB3033130.1 PrsW family intramembrane metalloprotease [Mycolicibacter sp. MYC340]
MPAIRNRKVGASRLVIILLAILTALLLLFTAANPGGTLTALVLSSLAMLVVLLCYRWLDRWEPEPRRLLQLAFLWGASVAVVLAVGLETFGSTVATVKPLVSKTFDQAAIQAPFIEEAAKGLFLLIMLTGRRRHQLNSLTDCMVYAGVTAVGFAWMEDIVYIAPAESPTQMAAVAVARLIFGPFAHPLFTTMTGIGVFFALRRHGFWAKAFVILLGYLAAVGMHALWNASLAMGGGQMFLVTYVFWMIPIFILVVVLAMVSRRHEQHLVATKLPGMVMGGLISPNEQTWLGSIRSRKLAIREAKRIGGRPAAQSVKKFAAQVVELAFVRDRIDRGFGDPEVFALQHEDAYGVVAARAAAPVLYTMAGYHSPLPVRR